MDRKETNHESLPPSLKRSLRRRNAEIFRPRSGDELVPGTCRGRASIPPRRPECHPVRHEKRGGRRSQRIPRSPLGHPRRFDAEAVGCALDCEIFTPFGILRTAANKRRSTAGLGGDLPGAVEGTTYVPNDARIQGKVALSETLGLNRSSPDYYALQLGNHVLGGGFYATRLNRDLREKKDLSILCHLRLTSIKQTAH
jgi:hypothetical protein